MYRAVQRCKQYNELPWREERKPVAELYVYILLIVISIMCMPFLAISALFRIGSYANDGTRLGRDDVRESRLGEVEKTSAASVLLTIWRHFGPLSQFCHLVASFMLLLPSVFLQAREIEHGFHPIGKIILNPLHMGKCYYKMGKCYYKMGKCYYKIIRLFKILNHLLQNF